MATVDVLLISQERTDTLFADTLRLQTLIKTISEAKKSASLTGGAEIDDINKNLFHSHIAGRYVPFVSCLSNYSRTSTMMFPGPREQTLDFNVDVGNANFIGDVMLQFEIPRITLSDIHFDNRVTIVPSPGNGRIRYCQYPGIRLLEEVSLIINNEVKESYTWENIMEWMQHECPEDKRVAFEKCVGQQQMQVAPMSYTFNSEGAPDMPGTQLWTMYTNGPQTPKNEQDPLVMCVPIMFNVFRDETIPMPNFINVNKVTIRVRTANLINIVGHQVDMPYGTINNTFRFARVTLYSRGIFMTPQVSAMFNVRKKTLIRTWRTIRFLTEFSGVVSRQLSELKNPTECIYVRFIPFFNQITQQSTLFNEIANTIGNTTTLDIIPAYDYYHVAGRVTKRLQQYSSLGISINQTIFQNMQVIQANTVTPVVNSVGFSVQESEFFAGRISHVGAGPYMNFVESSIMKQPTSFGSFVINFAQQYRGDRSRQASGYIDLSLFNNVRLHWESTDIARTFPCWVIISVKNLNTYEPRPDGTIVYTYQN